MSLREKAEGSTFRECTRRMWIREEKQQIVGLMKEVSFDDTRGGTRKCHCVEPEWEARIMIRDSEKMHRHACIVALPLSDACGV